MIYKNKTCDIFAGFFLKSRRTLKYSNHATRKQRFDRMVAEVFAMTDNNKKTINKTEIIKTLKHIGIGVAIGIFLTSSVVIGSFIRKGQKEVPVVVSTSTEPDVRIVVEEEKKEKQLDIEYLTGKLANVGELSTAQMLYTGIVEVSEGKIPGITKKGFSMLYSAEVKAGIDVSLISITADEENVYVEVPSAGILSKHIDPDSIQFFDEKKALFNWSEKEDVTDALSLAENDLGRKAELDNIIEMSQREAEMIIKGLLEDAVGERKIVIRKGD